MSIEFIGMACALGLSAMGSALGAGAAALASVGAWKKCYSNGKPAPFIMVAFSGAPLTQTIYGFLLMNFIRSAVERVTAAGTLAQNNLLFMLMAFLASEGVKNYQASYSKLLYGLGAGQIARIFILPLQAHQALVKIGGAEVPVMGNAQFIRVVIYLAGSAACLLAAGVINQSKCTALAGHLKTLEAKEAS